MTYLSRRRLMAASALGTGLALAPSALPRLHAQPAKPQELIVRAWGGVWVEALEQGVSKPFTERTGIAVRHELTEDNEIRPKIWAAVDQGRAPPIHVNWDTSTNATKSALRGVTEDLGGLANLAAIDRARGYGRYRAESHGAGAACSVSPHANKQSVGHRPSLAIPATADSGAESSRSIRTACSSDAPS
jgi:hypothetical protein